MGRFELRGVCGGFLEVFHYLAFLGAVFLLVYLRCCIDTLFCFSRFCAALFLFPVDGRDPKYVLGLFAGYGVWIWGWTCGVWGVWGIMGCY